MGTGENGVYGPMTATKDRGRLRRTDLASASLAGGMEEGSWVRVELVFTGETGVRTILSVPFQTG